MSQATKTEMNQFVKTVDDFLVMRQKILKKQSIVYNSGNAELINDYESFMGKADMLKGTIENTVGAWNAAKSAYASVTDSTSTLIGDGIDEIRSWFGYDPSGGLGMLGAIQLPAAAWVAAIIASATILWRTGSALLTRIDAVVISRKQNIPYSEALVKANDANKWALFTGGSMLLVLGAGMIAWYFWNDKK